ncbi:thiol reductant ABC exporter subunit CydC [Allostreptomyces psammosilenae]|uniref:ATP-binding cassette subfamily C protein/ATP-binding cassette subfamily C protein CydC n=1 Tax=Allostreptomyces psammosilenae TaxID=1892865 RepID=A0A852ZY96_9ACTN|nr:thiol reductant ABC exporter subunit CydC [Allostreptomyces psammosilenae]NYI07353.1 ATP-binding cassette subfamily C protein/ATP-binding cassette subfamily C protein CydC [Allostreptomyces psammosilenae]
MIAVLRLVRLPRLLLAACAGTAAELCALALTATAAWLIARAAQQPPIAALSLAIVAVRGCAVFRGVLRYAERLAGHDVALRAVAELRGRVFDALTRLRADPARPADPAHPAAPGHGSAGERDGEALTRLVTDVEAVQDLLVRCLAPAASALAVGAAATALVTGLLPEAGPPLAAGLLAAGVLLPAGAALAARRLGDRIAAARAELAVHGLDLLEGAWELAACGATARALARAGRPAAALARLERRSGRVSAAVTAAGLLLQGATTLAVTLVAIGSGVDEVRLAVLALTALAAFEAVGPLGEAAQRYVLLAPAVRRIGALLTAPVPGHAPPPRSPSGRIRLRGVRVVFRPSGGGAARGDGGGVVALDGIDWSVPAGRSVAVVGASGAGKSTLLGVVAGLVRPDAGSVELPEARGAFQDAHLFATTIRANLALARPGASEAELRGALRTAGLLEWVATLPDGLDTPVGEGGRGLSGGQRQRLLLARALLADPPVLLLDEPTEGLDAAMADAVLRAVLRTRRGRTTVVVTHRSEVLPEFDEVVVMDRGRITAPADAPAQASAEASAEVSAVAARTAD